MLIFSSDDALGVLVAIADKNSRIVEEYTLPLLFGSLCASDLSPGKSSEGSIRKGSSRKEVVNPCQGCLFDDSFKFDMVAEDSRR